MPPKKAVSQEILCKCMALLTQKATKGDPTHVERHAAAAATRLMLRAPSTDAEQYLILDSQDDKDTESP